LLHGRQTYEKFERGKVTSPVGDDFYPWGEGDNDKFCREGLEGCAWWGDGLWFQKGA